jgi:hypothetical protein
VRILLERERVQGDIRLVPPEAERRRALHAGRGDELHHESDARCLRLDFAVIQGYI